MKDLIIAIGLIMFIEGLLLAMFPSRIKNMLRIMEKMPQKKLRNSGIFFVITGFLIIWYVKN
tara:strand:+ start:863 stop:1048 length:186 start_codon:yes stop_codon:yes gene_type:complete